MLKAKIFKEIKFEGVWDKLESEKYFQRPLVLKYVRLTVIFMWNSAQQEHFSFYFSGLFSFY